MEPVRTDMTPQELRKFGLITAAMLVLFFDILIPWIWGIALPVWPLIAASILILMALLVWGAWLLAQAAKASLFWTGSDSVCKKASAWS